LSISGTSEATNFKFGVQVDYNFYKEYSEKNEGKKGAWSRSRELLFEFWDPRQSL